MLVVNWQRQTTAGGTEENYFYCDNIEQAEDFKKTLENSNNGEVNFISEVTNPIWLSDNKN